MRKTDPEKLDKARADLARWLSKLKRACKAVEQFSRRIEYYERKIAAAREVEVEEATAPKTKKIARRIKT